MSDLSSLERTILLQAVQEGSPAGLLEPVLEEEQQQQQQQQAWSSTSHADGEDDIVCGPQDAAPCNDRKHVRYLTNVQKLEQQLAATSWKDANVALALCREYNSAAMRVLDSGGLDLACQLLDKAQVLCEPGGLLSSNPRQQRTLHAATLNNLAVYHRHRARPAKALALLQHALTLERSPPDNASVVDAAGDEVGEPGHSCTDNPAATLINICTVLSGMGRHAEGLQHAREAAATLCAMYQIQRRELEAWCSSRALTADIQLSQITSGRPGTSSHRSGNGGGAWLQRPSDGGASTTSKSSLGSTHSRMTGTSAASRSSVDEAAVARVGSALKYVPPSQCSALAMAYYNEAVELEHLEDDSCAMQSYALAAALATKMFGRGSNLALAFNKSLQAVKVKCKAAWRRPYKQTPTSLDTSAQPPPPVQSHAYSTLTRATAASAGSRAKTSGHQGTAMASAPSAQRQAGNQHHSGTLPQLRSQPSAPQPTKQVGADQHNPYIPSSRPHSTRRTPQAGFPGAVPAAWQHTTLPPNTAHDKACQAHETPGKRPAAGTSSAGILGQTVVASQAATRLDHLFQARRTQLQALKGSLGKTHS